MALTQMQIIQSLGEAMGWFERELSWDIPPTELRHLTGRIGELYTALITNGQMATEVNQKGYDVVGSDGEKISVKTTAMMGNNGHISFNATTLEFVDRIIVLRINTEEMQIEILLNSTRDEAIELMTSDAKGKRTIALSKLSKKQKSNIAAIKEVVFENHTIKELENGTIEVEHKGKSISPTRPILREFAKSLNISTINNKGNDLNTRQLGTLIIRLINELSH